MAKIDLPLFESRTEIRTALDVTYRSNRRALVIRDYDDHRLITFGAALNLQAKREAVTLADIWDGGERVSSKLVTLAARDFKKSTVSGDIFADFKVGQNPLHDRVWHEVSGQAEILRLVGGVVRCFCDGDPDISCDPAQLVNGTCPGCHGDVDCG